MNELLSLKELDDALRCSLCNGFFKNPHTFKTCHHTFCYDCVIERIEGVGINTSKCPTCNLPGWKKDLAPNVRMNNAAEHAHALLMLTLSPGFRLLLPAPPAAAGAASPRGAPEDSRPPSPPIQPGNEPAEEEPEEAPEGDEQEEGEEEQRQRQEEAAVPAIDFGAADFGEAWRAAQLAKGPPKTPEEMQALRHEIALLEAALELCDTLPCKPSTVAQAATGGAQSQGSKPPRKLSELAKEPAPATGAAAAAATAMADNTSGAAADRKRASGAAPADAQEGRTAKRHRTEKRMAQVEAAADVALRSGPKPAATAEEREKENAGARARASAGHNRGRGKTPQPQPLAPVGAGPSAAPQQQQQPQQPAPPPPPQQHLAVIPDSQGLEDMELSIGGGPQAAPRNMQGAAATPVAGFQLASQLPHGGAEPENHDAHGSEFRSLPHHPQHAQPFSLNYPAAAPHRSRSRSVSPSRFTGSAPKSGFNPSKPYFSQGVSSAGRSGGRSGGPPRPSLAGDMRKFVTTQSAAAAAVQANGRLRPVVLSLDSCHSGSQGAEALAVARTAAEKLMTVLPNVVLCDEVTSDTTHVVVATDDARIALRRRAAFLKGLAVGAWVVGPAWVEACANAESLVKEENYEVLGCKKKGKDGAPQTSSMGVPERTRKKMKKKGRRLFEGRIVVLERFTKGSEKLKELVKELLELGGANVQDKGPRPNDTLTVSDDAAMVEGLLARGKSAVLAQWVLESVAEGALAPHRDFQPGGKHWE